jgi:hypothetical protein
MFLVGDVNVVNSTRNGFVGVRARMVDGQMYEM